MNHELIRPLDERYTSFLSDESKEEGYADTISFPTSSEELLQIIHTLPSGPVTLQGANTGVEGASVPHGGHIINFSKMNHVLKICQTSETDGYAVTEPGVTLEQLTQEIRRQIKSSEFIWPPSPTETSATVGGVISTNAYGMNSYYYGTKDPYLKELTVLHRNGIEETLTDVPADFQLPEDSAVLSATLKLVKRPSDISGVAFFFENETKALECARELQKFTPADSDAAIISMEYMGNTAIKMTDEARELISALRNVPSLPQGVQAIIYVEIAGNPNAQDEVLMDLMDVTTAYESDPDIAWALTGYNEIQKIHDLRHAATETVIQFIEKKHGEDKRITKLGVKPLSRGRSFTEIISSVMEELEREHLRASIYAHIKNSDIQVNFLPENYEEYLKCKNIANNWI